MLFGTPSLLSFQFFVIVFYTCIYIQWDLCIKDSNILLGPAISGLNSYWEVSLLRGRKYTESIDL